MSEMKSWNTKDRFGDHSFKNVTVTLEQHVVRREGEVVQACYPGLRGEPKDW